MRLSAGLFLITLIVTCSAGQTPPPGSIVIRPNGTPTSTSIHPDKAGYIVIRPGSNSPAGAQPPASPDMPKLVGVGSDKKPAPPKWNVPEPGTGKAEPADPKLGKVLFEAWDAAFLRGMRIGYFHILVREHRHDGKDYVYATKTLKLTVSRFGQRSEQWAEDSTLEDQAGNVLLTRMRQGLGKDQKLQLMGQVKGDILSVTVEGVARGSRDVPFPPGVLGVAKEAQLFKDRKPKKGDKLDYITYEGRVNQVVRFNAVVKGEESGSVLEGHKKRTFLIVEQGMEPVQGFQLPPATVWVDAETFEPLKMETDDPILGGKLILIRTTKEFCLRPLGAVPELNEVQSIRIAQDIPGIHNKSSVTYRIKLSRDLAADKAFRTDYRQKIDAIDATSKSFELEVLAARKSAVGQEVAGPEYLSDCFYIDWNNEPTKKLAQAAIVNLPPTASDWDKARAVESWVNRNMRTAEFSQAMATCSNVARTLSGDCTEYAMLAAGMCRALGVPSRTALGLVFAHGRDGGAILAYHMWFEAFADGHWVPFDATLGNGGVGPGHLKITDAHWNKEESFKPILPVLNVLGATPKVEIVRVK
jgi:transglutaminase-like putative cysteine protease